MLALVIDSSVTNCSPLVIQFKYLKLDLKYHSLQSSQKSVRAYMTESYKMFKMYLKIQDSFTRPNEFLPNMSGGQTEFRED